MYILTSDGKSIVDTSFVERFCLVEKPDAYLIIASYNAERAVTPPGSCGARLRTWQRA